MTGTPEELERVYTAARELRWAFTDGPLVDPGAGSRIPTLIHALCNYEGSDPKPYIDKLATGEAAREARITELEAQLEESERRERGWQAAAGRGISSICLMEEALRDADGWFVKIIKLAGPERPDVIGCAEDARRALTQGTETKP